ncbi:MAG TPA: aldehyde dehydrogenase family protein, partial [Chitinophagaceae bacterium]|nr:aldehyde dehydrogenase family protein [Chitinophagaceae bacterium]
MQPPFLSQLQSMRQYFDAGNTRTYAFRRNQLLQLKQSMQKHEQELHRALYDDLKKSPEEAWVTETGFVMSEINTALRHLRRWMQPVRTSTNLVNLPSGSFIMKEPLGVVLIISPWNYPLQLLFTPLVGAIAAGNCVVLKPSEFAPATAGVMRKIIQDTFPPEYVQYVMGDGSEVIPAMMNNFRFNHVFYTGSTAVGRIIYKMAADQLVPVTLELGGKSPCVIESDANIKVAARRIAVTKFSNAGQMCVAPDYLLVHASRKDELIMQMKRTIASFFGDDPATSYNYGKIINE